MFKDLNNGVDAFNKIVSKWAVKHINKAWQQRQKAKQANEVVDTLAHKGLTFEEAQEAENAILNGADPQTVRNHFLQVARNRERLNNPPPIHGGARFALREDLHPKGLLHDADKHWWGGKGLFLGGLSINDERTRALNDNWLFWDGEGHISTVAATGSGKSRYLVIPNLLRYEGSCVVHDPKGELYHSTSDYRRTIGKVYRISPFEKKTHSFNPLRQIQTMDDARALAELLLPRKSTGDAQFYDDEAINFLSAFILYVATIRPGQDAMQKGVVPGTIDELRERTAVMSETLREELELLAKDYMPRPIRRAAQVAMTKSMDKGLPSLIQSLNQSMAIWDDDGLIAATSYNDFDFRDLKNETITVYLHVPLEKMQAYKQFMQIVLTTALDAMTRNPVRPQKPVLFVLDEFLTLGHFPPFLSALRTHRDAGVRLWYLMQDVSSLREIYPENWNSFFSQTALRTYFGTNDTSEAEFVSEQTGMTTVAYENTSVSTSSQASEKQDHGLSMSMSQSNSVQYVGRPLMTPDEVISTLSRQEDDGTVRFAISRINTVAQPIVHLLTTWDKGEFGMSRFGGPAYVRHSEILMSIFDRVNEQAFGAQQSQPKGGVAWVDFSMGRDDGSTPHGIGAMYQIGLDRIAISPKYYFSEVHILADMEHEDREQSQESLLAIDFLYRLILHEMIHRKVANVQDGHSKRFLAVCRNVYKRLGAAGRGIAAPTPENVGNWPISGA